MNHENSQFAVIRQQKCWHAVKFQQNLGKVPFAIVACLNDVNGACYWPVGLLCAGVHPVEPGDSFTLDARRQQDAPRGPWREEHPSLVALQQGIPCAGSQWIDVQPAAAAAWSHHKPPVVMQGASHCAGTSSRQAKTNAGNAVKDRHPRSCDCTAWAHAQNMKHRPLAFHHQNNWETRIRSRSVCSYNERCNKIRAPLKLQVDWLIAPQSNTAPGVLQHALRTTLGMLCNCSP